MDDDSKLKSKQRTKEDTQVKQRGVRCTHGWVAVWPGEMRDFFLSLAITLFLSKCAYASPQKGCDTASLSCLLGNHPNLPVTAQESVVSDDDARYNPSFHTFNHTSPPTRTHPHTRQIAHTNLCPSSLLLEPHGDHTHTHIYISVHGPLNSLLLLTSWLLALH